MARVRLLHYAFAFTLCLNATGCPRSTGPATPSQPVAPSPASPDTVLAQLSSASRAAVTASPVGVLLPPDEPLLRTAIVTAGERWYAFSIPLGDVTVSLHATDAMQPLPASETAPDGHDHEHAPPRPAQRVRSQSATVTVNEGIRSVAWIESGVAYTLEVECERPFEDTRCTDDAYVLGFAERLVRVGGAR